MTTNKKKIVKKAVKPSTKQSNTLGFALLTVLQLFTAALVVVAAVVAIFVPFNNGDILMAATLVAFAFLSCILVQVCYDL